MGFRIELDLDRCIGCLACTRCENFVCGNDLKVRPVRSEVAEIGCNQEAAAICPVGAIRIYLKNSRSRPRARHESTQKRRIR